MANDTVIGFLTPFKVLDLTTDKGYYLYSKILGDLGAQVTRIEKPGVSKDYWWLAYNQNKKLVTLDIEKEKDQFLKLVKETDFLVEDFAPGYLERLGLSYTALKKANPKLIMTSITPFGQSGPYKDWKAGDLEQMALSGTLFGIGDPDRAPVRISFPQSEVLTSAEAVVGTMMALYWRELTGDGQHVDVSGQESVHAVMSGAVSHKKVEVTGSSRKRIGPNHPALPGIGLTSAQKNKYTHPIVPLTWKCKEGYVAYLVHNGMRGAYGNKALVKWMEKDGPLPEWFRAIKWETFDGGQTSPEDMQKVWDVFAAFFARHTYHEMYQISLKERIELFPSNTMADVLAEEQLVARKFWQEDKLPGSTKTVKYPGPFAKVRLSSLPPDPMPKVDAKQVRYPFQGVKVLDFTWVYTGPWTTQWLATNGAQVIKVESSTHLDTGRRGNAWGFAAWNTGKKSLTLNLKDPRGKDIAQRLVKWADVVTENFTPGTLAKLGFGYDDLVKINPRIVMFSASMFGADGPHASQPGMGQQLTCLSGFNEITGWPDRMPVSPHGPYTDIIACRMAGSTLFAALNYQRRTGKGCFIDMSQFEASLHFLAPLLLEYQAAGKLPFRMGNRSLTDSPHGVFPCQGEDRWCSLSISNDAEWQAFRKVVGKAELNDAKFATFESRKKNEDELEKIISAWTSPLTCEEVMTRLQQAGVKAGIISDWDDQLKDPQLNYRKHFIPVTHPQLGEYDFSNSGFRLEKSSPVVAPAPLFGEHNKYVLTEILGMSEATFDEYTKAGVLQ